MYSLTSCVKGVYFIISSGCDRNMHDIVFASVTLVFPFDITYMEDSRHDL